MTKISVSDAEQLLKVVEESLRHRWEIKNLNSRSLVDVQRQRISASEAEKEYKLKIDFWHVLTVMAALTSMLFLLKFYLNLEWVMRQSIFIKTVALWPVLITALCLYRSTRLKEKRQAASETMEACEDVIVGFNSSVQSLNPLGIGNPYHDVVNERVIKQRAVLIACKLLDAEAEFDRLRLDPDLVRGDVIRAGNWLQKCQEWFDKLWLAATVVFGLELDKASIFEQAKKERACNTYEKPATVPPIRKHF